MSNRVRNKYSLLHMGPSIVELLYIVLLEPLFLYLFHYICSI